MRGEAACEDKYGNPTKRYLPKWKWDLIKGQQV